MQLTERDRDILRHVHRHRFLRSSHLAALIGGVLGVAPWLGSLGQISQRPLQEGLWALAAFVAAAALSALLATLVRGLVQLRLAGLAFDRTLRMTRGEAREAAKDDSPRRRMQRARWRLA